MRSLIVMGITLLILTVSLEPWATAQDSPIDQALRMARQVDGVTDVGVEIVENGRRGQYDCHGRNARVMGNSNVVSFQNCGTVSVPGNDNTVAVNGAQLLKIYGNSNRISWSGRQKPQINNPGSKNTIMQAPLEASTPAPSRSSRGRSSGGSAIIIDQSTPRSYEMNCDGRDVQVSAGSVSVLLHGECGTIRVDGAMNKVSFDSARRLSVTGTGNSVRWANRPVSVNDNGTGNSLASQ